MLPDHFNSGAELLSAVREYTLASAMGAMGYYRVAKRPMKRGATWLRLTGLLALGAGGVIPILAQMYPERFAAGWASLALTLAAGAVALDRYFGFSSAWMRFTVAELKLQRELEQFRLDWQAEEARWVDAPSAEQVQQGITTAKNFLSVMQQIVEAETAAWVTEFQSNLKQLDESARVRPIADTSGAIQVTITNGEQATSGWTLTVDGGSALDCHGKTAALRNLAPGHHTVRAVATINAKTVTAERVAAVVQGTIVPLELTLS
jgi:hypothetical protein